MWTAVAVLIAAASMNCELAAADVKPNPPKPAAEPEVRAADRVHLHRQRGLN